MRTLLTVITLVAAGCGGLEPPRAAPRYDGGADAGNGQLLGWQQGADQDGGVLCPDSDRDGTCDDEDRCPGRSDADADHDGYPDACDRVLAVVAYGPAQLQLPAQIANARFVLCVGAADCTANPVVLSTPATAHTAQSIADAGKFTRVTQALGTKAQYLTSRLHYEVPAAQPYAPPISSANVMLGTVGQLATFGSQLQRAVCTGTLTADGKVQVRWELRGY